MNQQSIWTDEEEALIGTVLERLVSEDRADDCQVMRKNLAALECQFDALSLYPCIAECSRISGSERNIDTLVAALGNKYPDEDVFVVPTKALLGRCFEVSRINLLYMVGHLVPPSDAASAAIRDEAFRYIMKHMLDVMTEDVLLQILGDPMQNDAKGPAANVLAQIWEKRASAQRHAFSPELSNMWLIRRNVIPVFGTLAGTHEYISLYQDVDGVCRDYIMRATQYDEEAAALEEFLFGLPFEELEIVKSGLLRSKKPCANREDIVRILGKDSIYLSSKAEDPLEIYRFFNYRRKCAMSRRYTQSNGPVCTFEENFMRYLLLKNAL
ncbi:MAG TPA: hypothetical protein P5279_01550 [Anaerohalosphaeraceae bacterium]|nr:hypothetical protein [Anaerohalosphaeraceae bacterium]HRT49153.1 hypothetical protein [Anaerohalosphaeraceae bacterium]HRT87786.1 hypothetical protein [Anaerohalosphaeraceae bacterium]